MNNSRQGLHGIIIVGLSAVITLGSIVAALAETGGNTPQQPAPSATQQEITASPTPTERTLQNTPIPQPTNTSAPSSPTATETVSSSQTCNPPEGWTFYTVKTGETLEILSQTHSITSTEIMEANCLTSAELPSGTILFLPPQEGSAASTAECGPPDGWKTYTVKEDDNLFRISLAFNTTVAELQLANCLSDTQIRTGQSLYVPGGSSTP